jgi:hypothetical protein
MLKTLGPTTAKMSRSAYGARLLPLAQYGIAITGSGRGEP